MPPIKLFHQTFPWRGLWLSGDKDAAPQGSLRRARGVSRIQDGPIRLRHGLLGIADLDAHSIIRYNNKRYAGSTTKFYEDGVEIHSGLDGTRLTFAKMPPTLTKQDYLFVSGGFGLFKVSPAGTVSKWGLDGPIGDPLATDHDTGTLAAGAYDYYVTFLNQSTGHRSNSTLLPAEVTIAINRTIQLTGIPVSLDPQVDAREIWRTVADGSQPFYLATIIDNTTTTYDDDGSVALTAQQLPTDNAPPSSALEDCVGPFEKRMWWCRSTEVGAGGRIYYSPIGRPESVEGFLDATNPDDATQKLVIWNGLWLITNRAIKRVVSRLAAPLESKGVKGTVRPFTVAVTPLGIMYESDEGVRLFNGVDSVLVSIEQLGQLFQGVAIENLNAMSGVVAGFARDEYLISDTVQTLALNIRKGAWRDIGIGCNAIYYEDDTELVQVSALNKIYIFEDEESYLDDATPIAFAVEFPSKVTDASSEGVVQRLYIDLNTQSELLTPTLILDGSETTLAAIGTASRRVIEIPVNRKARRIGLRLTGNLSANVEVVLYDITVDIYVPPSVAV